MTDVALPVDALQPEDGAAALPLGAKVEQVAAASQEITRRQRRRERVVSTAMVLGDMLGLVSAFGLTTVVLPLGPALAFTFLACLPVWVAGAHLLGLHRDESLRTGNSTVDELGSIFKLVTTGSWLFVAGVYLSGIAPLSLSVAIVFWALAIPLTTVSRMAVRSIYRQRAEFPQNTVIVGAGEVGQLLARKLFHHPEYGLRLLGFVDDRPKEQRPDLQDLKLLGAPGDLPGIVRDLEVERIIVAFSNEPEERTLALLRSVPSLGVRVDVVPRLFEGLTLQTVLDSVEGIPLVALPAHRRSRVYAVSKRAFDVIGALIGLILSAPLFALIAWRIKRDSPGPVFHRQTRCGMGAREFTNLKFRTMAVDTSADLHREYIRSTMTSRVHPETNGLFKLERGDAITRVGRWLRTTSLDELPQLINVLRGDMSLVGPRPCIPYEIEYFAPHHFERFLVPAGLTGLWQVTARGHSTFGEALDMDVAYAHSCSFGLDLRLILRTPMQMFSPNGTG